MKIVRTPMGFNIDASAINECEFPEVMKAHLQEVVEQAKEGGYTVDWSTLCALPEETRVFNMAGDDTVQIRHLHVTVDGMEIIEEEA